jgi:hypothetical protein
MSTFSDDEAIARLQQDFLSTISSVVEKPKLLKRNIRRLETYHDGSYQSVKYCLVPVTQQLPLHSSSALKISSLSPAFLVAFLKD